MTKISGYTATAFRLGFGGLLLTSCVFWGGGTTEPSPSSPAPLMALTVTSVLGKSPNPGWSRLNITVAVAGRALDAYATDFQTSTDALGAVRVGDQTRDSLPVTVTHTWPNLSGGSPAEVRIEAHQGGWWVYDATWNGVLPRHDTTLVITLHPVYDGVIATGDTVSQLQGLVNSTWVMSPSFPFVQVLFGAAVDSLQAATEPYAIDIVYRNDSLFSADLSDSLGIAALLGKSTGSCRLLPLSLGTRAGYQTLSSSNALLALWQEKAAKSAVDFNEGDWILIAKEDYLYLLHALGRDGAGGRAVEFYTPL